MNGGRGTAEFANRGFRETQFSGTAEFAERGFRETRFPGIAGFAKRRFRETQFPGIAKFGKRGSREMQFSGIAKVGNRRSRGKHSSPEIRAFGNGTLLVCACMFQNVQKSCSLGAREMGSRGARFFLSGGGGRKGKLTNSKNGKVENGRVFSGAQVGGKYSRRRASRAVDGHLLPPGITLGRPFFEAIPGGHRTPILGTTARSRRRHHQESRRAVEIASLPQRPSPPPSWN